MNRKCANPAMALVEAVAALIPEAVVSVARLLADLWRVGDLTKVWLTAERLRQPPQVFRHRQQLALAQRSSKFPVTVVLRGERIEFTDKRLETHESQNPPNTITLTNKTRSSKEGPAPAHHFPIITVDWRCTDLTRPFPRSITSVSCVQRGSSLRMFAERSLVTILTHQNETRRGNSNGLGRRSRLSFSVGIASVAQSHA